MDDILFNIIAVTATFAFVLSLVTGWWPLILASLILAGVLFWFLRRIP